MAELGAHGTDRLARRPTPPKPQPRSARPMRRRSTRPKRGSTGRKPRRRSSGRCARSIPCRAPGSKPTASGSSCWRRPRTAGCRFAGMTGGCWTMPCRPMRRGHHSAVAGPARGRGPMSAGRAAARLPDSQGHDPAVTRWRLTIEYDGGPFMGWQRQDHGPSVQQALEEALAEDDRPGSASSSRPGGPTLASMRWR